MSYTKGEWKVFRFSQHHHWKIDTGDPDWFIDCGMNEANANLIAAAPELYETLKRLIEETDLLNTEECDHDVGICWCPYKNARFQAAHALAKAEGRKQ